MTTITSITQSGLTQSGIASSAAPATGNPAGAQRAELARAAKAFEAIFVRQLIGSMREAGQGDDIMGSSAVDQFQDMSDARTADTLADKGGLGIANMLLQQLDRASQDKSE